MKDEPFVLRIVTKNVLYSIRRGKSRPLLSKIVIKRVITGHKALAMLEIVEANRFTSS